MSDDEESVSKLFDQCEQTIKDSEDSKCTPEQLQQATETLEKLSLMIRRLDLFSPNEEFTELPTSSLRYLLVSAYLGYALQNSNDFDNRIQLLKGARAFYRNYCESLLRYRVIAFKLDWLDEDGQAIPDVEEPGLPERKDLSFERDQNVVRSNVESGLRKALLKLEIEKRRNNDDATIRECVVVLLRLWALIAVKELRAIEKELPLVYHAQKIRRGEIKHEEIKPPIKLPPFIITKTENQRKVYGLGYPSIPTYTVDQWYDGMVKSGKFGDISNLNVQRIDSTDVPADDVVQKYEDDSEEARQKAMAWDEYKDWHKRGEGNTHGKG